MFSYKHLNGDVKSAFWFYRPTRLFVYREAPKGFNPFFSIINIVERIYTKRVIVI